MDSSQIMLLELGSKGYSCGQILIICALRMMGQDNEYLVRAMSALAQGGGNTGQTCGALLGGLSVLSLYTAKGNDFEEAMPEEAQLWEELTVWFETDLCKGCGTSCNTILGVSEAGGQLQMNQMKCGRLLAEVWRKCLMLLEQYGIDPTSPR